PHPGARQVGGGAARRRAAVPPGDQRRAAGGLRDELPPVPRRGGPRREDRLLRRRRLRAVVDQHPRAHLLQARRRRPLIIYPRLPPQLRYHLLSIHLNVYIFCLISSPISHISHTRLLATSY
uniref:Uncharacterized protein n=1 Tax=Oryza brachyantha TaxID=4533 RepID=J3LPZ6_ORYBR